MPTGIQSSPRQRSSLECPICLALFTDPSVTSCGHTFCAKCIALHAHRAPNSTSICPVCDKPFLYEALYPNAALAVLVQRARARGLDPTGADQRQTNIDALSDDELDRLLSHLLRRKARTRADRQTIGTRLMISFLEESRTKKASALNTVKHQLSLIDNDLAVLRRRTVEMDDPLFANGNHDAQIASLPDSMPPELSTRNHLIARYRDNVETAYFQRRSEPDDDHRALEEITNMLVDATSVSGVRKRCSIQHIDILRSNHNLISSIEFNAPATLFATAGVTKRIKVFDFNTMLPVLETDDLNHHHYPILEIPTVSKLSCLSWSRKQTSILAASTYKGDILIHDTETNTQLKALREHTQRTWYVDFSLLRPTLLLSGSDDHTVKLWDVDRQSESAMTLQTKANVCCVKFNPHESHEFAFGSADHNVYSYDLRHPRTPLCVFEGHWRAVSHVLFMNRSELISASTDSSCKLWNVQKQEPGLSYAGHTNNRNFVGLSGRGDFFACGSEDNSLYVYNKRFAGPVVRYGFGSRAEFVSTVAWKPDSNVLVAANNTGGIEVLEVH